MSRCLLPNICSSIETFGTAVKVTLISFFVFATNVMSEPISNSHAAMCDVFAGSGNIRERTMFMGWDVSLDGPADGSDFVTVRYDRAYEDGPNISGASFGGQQRDYTARFALNIEDGSPFTNGSSIPLTEWMSIHVFVSSRGSIFDVSSHFASQTGRPVWEMISDEEIEWAVETYKSLGPYVLRPEAYAGFTILGEPSSFHGLTEITHANRHPWHSDSKQIYISGDHPHGMEHFFVCSRPDVYPNPQCVAYLDHGVFDVDIRFRRDLIENWPQIEKLTRDFITCLTVKER